MNTNDTNDCVEELRKTLSEASMEAARIRAIAKSAQLLFVNELRVGANQELCECVWALTDVIHDAAGRLAIFLEGGEPNASRQ